MNLVQSLDLAGTRVIAFCGAGGKTSLMFALAEAFAKAGDDVLVCTTTKMSLEQVTGRWHSQPAQDAEAIRALAGRFKEPVIAYHHVDTARAKVVGHPVETVDRVAAAGAFDRILIEADGSARKPLKAPAVHEPVFPTLLDAVVVVAGASGLDRPLNDENVFRAELWSRWTGLAIGEPVTPESLATMVVHPDGLARNAPERTRRVLFINQCDDSARITSAHRALAQLREHACGVPDYAVLGRLRPDEQVLHRASFRAK